MDNFRGVFQAIRWPIDATLTGIESALQAVPDLLMLVIIGLLAWQAAGRRLAIGSVISMAIVGLIGAWSQAMVTLALVLTSVVFCVVIGLATIGGVGIVIILDRLTQGSYSAIIADTIARYRQGEPIFYYTWTPYWISGVLTPGKDVIWLQVPFSSLPGERKDVDTSLPPRAC